MTETVHYVDEPSISVVVPCLNDAQLLARCLDSVNRQTVPAHEIIVVDNGSADDSAAVARARGARVITEYRRGITWASAAGFDDASGDLLVRTDADAVVPPDHLARTRETWRMAAQAPGRTVVGVTGSARFEIPGVLGDLLSRVYLGSYLAGLKSTLGHYPLYGTNCSIRADWWTAVRAGLELADTYVHDDAHLSFAVRPDETVWYQPDLVVDMDDRALRGVRQLITRYHRGFHTVVRNWRTQPPHRRLARRGKLGTRLRQAVGS